MWLSRLSWPLVSLELWIMSRGDVRQMLTGTLSDYGQTFVYTIFSKIACMAFVFSFTNNLFDSWAATTGRPPTIPSPYLNQCNMLLNVFQPTVQEEMVLAEILLYSIVNRKLARHSYLDSKGECEEFTTWRQRWAHLFG